ncbi:hypothetical protein CCHL11_03262 [Colletotrichum chlorophyti]|uniref:Serine aminopeptidase S33 domain-containing protein n=1 Tax=Colletotrichum chlorophyti TaxID=708187 RepID=A0A1Q8S412_9PEZI|nr:hypothetical protein CCHL11_03262 [Colletotrichum chlorophyti]
MAAAVNKSIAAVVVQKRAQRLVAGARTRHRNRDAGQDPILSRVARTRKAGTSKAMLQDPAEIAMTDDMTRRGKNWGKLGTVQSLLHCAMFEPLAFIQRIAPIPLFMVVAENDATTPLHLQREEFNRAREPKKLQLLKGQDHFSMNYGEGFEKNVAAQIAFLKETLDI